MKNFKEKTCMIIALLTIMMLQSSAVYGQIEHKVLSKILNVEEVSSVQPASTNNVGIYQVFTSVIRNEVQLLDLSKNEYDASVIFVVENDNGHKRLFILDYDSHATLAVAELQNENHRELNGNDVFSYNAVFDNIMGYKQKSCGFSLYAPSDTQKPFISIIMEVGANIKLELGGMGTYPGDNKTLYDLLK
jgi:hypothetical protein